MGSQLENIQEALNSHLNSLQSANVVWPNAGASYTPSPGIPFLAVHNLFLPTHQATLGEGGGENLVSGIYQIDAHVPEGAGWSGLMQKADQVIDYFKRGTSLTYGGVTVRITKATPEISIREGGWFRLPVSIYWEAFTLNT